MKFYLSSYSFGEEIEKLKAMLPSGGRIAHIINAQDRDGIVPVERPELQMQEMKDLNRIGWRAEALDLRDYFGKEAHLKRKLDDLDGVWISGGNTFVLRQAFRLSGFDNIFDELKGRKDFLYAGYSAAICVLCDSLKYIQFVDEPTFFPYPSIKEAIWEGLNVFDYGLLPHYRSDHHESAAIEQDVQNCIDNKWLFKALRDGEVIVMER